MLIAILFILVLIGFICVAIDIKNIKDDIQSRMGGKGGTIEPNTVFCEGCGVCINENFVKTVSYVPICDMPARDYKFYYCTNCAPAYDRVIDGKYYKANVECTKSGKIKK